MDETNEVGGEPNSAASGELASIAYLLVTLESMRTWNLISAEAYATVVAEAEMRRAEIAQPGRQPVEVESAASMVIPWWRRPRPRPLSPGTLTTSRSRWCRRR